MKRDVEGNRPAARMDGTQKRQAIFAEFMKRSTVPHFNGDAIPETDRPKGAAIDARHRREHANA